MFSTNQKISILQEVIQIKSINNNEARVAQYYADLLDGYGIESQIVKYSADRHNLIAEIRGERPGKVLVFSGHMDVVDVNEEDWTHPPFEGKIVDGKMYGRGTTDMKAGLTALILAMIEIKEEKIPFQGTIRLVATLGEEIGMLGSKQVTEEGYVDDADGFLIGEPSSPAKIINSHKGSIQYEIIGRGRAAHSSTPELGADAIQPLVDYIQLSNQYFAEELPVRENEQMGQTINVNTVLDAGNQINSVADTAILRANARTVPEVDNSIVIDIIERSINEVNQQNKDKPTQGKLELNILQNNFAVESEVHNDLVQAIRTAVGKEIPSEPLSGATDASNFGQIDKDFDLAIYGPGSLDLAHVADEYVKIDEYIEFIDIYKNTITHYLN